MVLSDLHERVFQPQRPRTLAIDYVLHVKDCTMLIDLLMFNINGTTRSPVGKFSIIIITGEELSLASLEDFHVQRIL